MENRRENADFIEILGKLNAPNEVEALTFDDQILFSKAAAKLAERIYYDTQYDLISHAKKNINELIAMTSRYQNNPRRIRAMLIRYFAQIYPIKPNNYTEQIAEIEKLLMS